MARDDPQDSPRPPRPPRPEPEDGEAGDEELGNDENHAEDEPMPVLKVHGFSYGE